MSRPPADTGAPDDRTRMRRLDRAKDDVWIREFLRTAPFGFLATLGEDAQPYLNSNLFVFDDEERCLYLHTHRTGRTRANVDAHEKVAFSAAGIGRLLPASQALEFSVEYAGVVVFGVGRVVEDPEEASHGLRLLLEKYAPHLEYGVDYRGTTPDELERTAVYRIDIEAWSGKQKEAPADLPGAYELPLPSIPFPRRTV
ncbi:MAG: pyridoxamine 5'-phosphate oxidase family protein [Gemmatimonadetes bacterium]|nr:pyridoxamine 5'-phosphate oxidase family protein [Gemmatimonadota bacterium]